MPRRARLDAPGTLHHVIVRGVDKRSIVDDRWDRRNFVSRLAQVSSDTETAIYAWALMTDHAHILLRSSHHGLSRCMRRFLTGYAITYNLRHKSHGRLFQDRYKSIVCDEDAYFRELVRYIHLNPLRARAVKNMSELDKYHWSGHSVLMGTLKHEWQDRDYVLSWFGQRQRDARRAYRTYVEEGVEQGSRPELVGGGLVRSLGGWSQLLSLRSKNKRVLADERILGTGAFVRKVVSKADKRIKYQLGDGERRKKAQQLIEQTCKREDVNANELRMGSRRGRVARVRREIAHQLVERYGCSLAEVARQLGVTPSAISKAISRLSRR